MAKKLLILVVLIINIMKELMIESTICLDSTKDIEKIMSSLNEVSDPEKEKVDEVDIEKKIDKVSEEKESSEMSGIDMINHIAITVLIFYLFTRNWFRV